MLRIGLAGLAILHLLGATTACRGPAPLAHVRSAKGEVSWRPDDKAQPKPAQPRLALHEGHSVSTGQTGEAAIEFVGGNLVELSPNSTLIIRRGGSAAAGLGAVIVAGRARASSSGKGSRLALSTPFGVAELGGAPTALELDTASGIRVLVGEVSVVAKDTKRVIGAGNALTVEGLVVPIGGRAETVKVALAPMQFVLIANPSQVQIKRAGETTWRTPTKRSVLASGDAVRTKKTAGTRVQFGDVADLTLGAKSVVTFSDAQASPESQRARYVLQSGTAALHLKRDAKVEVEHEIEAAGVVVRMEPGLAEATVEVATGAGGRADVEVRSGRAQLSDGTVLEAGSSATLAAGKMVGAVRPLAETHVDLAPGPAAVVYYQDHMPPVAFGWAADPKASGYEVEIARDRDFKDVVFRDRVSGQRLVRDDLAPDRYFWRVKGAGDWGKTSSVTLAKGGNTDCPNCKRHNVIDDTGQLTVVYFQKTLPAITLRWKAVTGAAEYRVRLFRDGEFDTPMADTGAKETTIEFPKGRFEEGKYYWLVAAKDGAGNELAPGRMNSLQIAYDNAVTDLTIRLPRANERFASDKIVTRGEVALGAKLYIDGKRAQLDGKGRFDEPVKLSPGLNQIAYRTLAADGVERYYLREVYRR